MIESNENTSIKREMPFQCVLIDGFLKTAKKQKKIFENFSIDNYKINPKKTFLRVFNQARIQSRLKNVSWIYNFK